MTLLNRLLSIVVVSSCMYYATNIIILVNKIYAHWLNIIVFTGLITAVVGSKKWILGASGASCDTACSTYNSGSVCSPDAIGSTYGWYYSTNSFLLNFT